MVITLSADGLAVMADGPWSVLIGSMQKTSRGNCILMYWHDYGGQSAVSARFSGNPISAGGDELNLFPLSADGLAVMADGPWCVLIGSMQKTSRGNCILMYWHDYGGQSAVSARFSGNPISAGGDELNLFPLSTDGLAVMADGTRCVLIGSMQQTSQYAPILMYQYTFGG
jgi:hypothetical protein